MAVVSPFYDMNLQDYLDMMGNRLAWRLVYRLASSVLKGLKHLRKKGILHRDLKPQNILVRGNCLNPQVVLCGMTFCDLVRAKTSNS